MGKKTKGRLKIKMEYISDKLKRYTTFSKRRSGIMKKAYELSTLTGTDVLLLVASETGHVYTYSTDRLKPIFSSDIGRQLIQQCLGADASANAEVRANYSHHQPQSNVQQAEIATGVTTHEDMNDAIYNSHEISDDEDEDDAEDDDDDEEDCAVDAPIHVGTSDAVAQITVLPSTASGLVQPDLQIASTSAISSSNSRKRGRKAHGNEGNLQNVHRIKAEPITQQSYVTTALDNSLAGLHSPVHHASSSKRRATTSYQITLGAPNLVASSDFTSQSHTSTNAAAMMATNGGQLYFINDVRHNPDNSVVNTSIISLRGKSDNALSPRRAVLAPPSSFAQSNGRQVAFMQPSDHHEISAVTESEYHYDPRLFINTNDHIPPQNHNHQQPSHSSLSSSSSTASSGNLSCRNFSNKRH